MITNQLLTYIVITTFVARYLIPMSAIRHSGNELNKKVSWQMARPLPLRRRFMEHGARTL